MSEKIKITEEELNSVRTLQIKFQETRGQFGDLYLEKMAIDAAIRSVADKEVKIQTEWKDLQKQENDIIQTILKKYGEGSLDIKEGVFIPDPKPIKNS